jgi:hypothetical protein
MNPLGNTFFTKNNSVVWTSGSWTQREGNASAEGLCEWGNGKSFWLRVSMTGEGTPWPFFNYALAFALQLRKGEEKLSHSSRLMSDTCRCVDMVVCLFRSSLVWPAVQQPPRLPDNSHRYLCSGTEKCFTFRAPKITLVVTHVDGVKLYLWTTACNEPVVHSQDYIWLWGDTVEWYWQGKPE